MTPKWLSRFLLLLVPVLFSVSTFAKPIDRRINFDHDAKIGRTELHPGDYEIIVDGDHITLKHGKQVVAESAAHWEKRDVKPDSDSIEFGPGNTITEIRFAGNQNVLVIANPLIPAN